jgi:putative transposase
MDVWKPATSRASGLTNGLLMDAHGCPETRSAHLPGHATRSRRPPIAVDCSGESLRSPDGRCPSAWQILVAALAGRISRQQDVVIEYLHEENRVLKQQLGRGRLRLTDDQRRRLAVRGKAIGRRALADVASIVTPDIILRWHRQLFAEKWTHKRRSPGRPRVMEVISDLVVRMARENPSWGYTRIQGALKNIGHRVGRTTVASILKENGIDPAPGRGTRTTWSQFLKAYWSVLAAADFFTVEVWAPRGLATFYIFFLIELATRRIDIAGITPSPSEAWMLQIGRNLTAPIDGFLADKKFIILDRDSKYSAAFRDLLKAPASRSFACLRAPQT